MTGVPNHQSNIGETRKDDGSSDIKRSRRINRVPRQISNGAIPCHSSSSKVDGRALILNWKVQGNRAVADESRVCEVPKETRARREVLLWAAVAGNSRRGVCN